MKLSLEKPRNDQVFESRRNSVTLEKGRINKTFGDSEAARREYDHLKLLKQRNVPVSEALELHENTLVLEFCPGKLLLDALLEAESMENFKCLEKRLKELAQWFALFYRAMPGYIRGDVNFRNFIQSPKGIIGIDFEEIPIGRPEADIGRILAFYASYDPVFTNTRKKSSFILAQSFINVVEVEMELLFREMDAGIAMLSKRRPFYDAEKAMDFNEDLKRKIKKLNRGPLNEG